MPDKDAELVQYQRAGEYVTALGLRVADEDLLKVAKAIGLGAQKAALTLERQAKGDQFR
jgi:hypothetical protein